MALFSGETTWFEYLASISSGILSTEEGENHFKVVDQKKKEAREFLASDFEKYAKSVKSKSKKEKGAENSIAWVDKIIQNGTLQDKVSGLSLKVSHCALHNLQSLDTLLLLAKNKRQRESKMACEALKELFIRNLLPPGRKLINFRNRPLKNENANEKVISIWLLEDELKSKYVQFLNVLQVQASNPLKVVKKDSMGFLLDLLKAHPEQEKFILMSLIDKFGDKDKKVSSSVSILLKILLEEHFNMRTVVVLEIERFIKKQKAVHCRPCYLAVTFLSQIIYSNDSTDPFNADLPAIVMSICVRLLDKSLLDSKPGAQRKKKGRSPSAQKHPFTEVSASKFQAIIFSALNRAFPYIAGDEELGIQVNKQLNSLVELLFKSAHSPSFSVAVQSLSLLFKIMKAKSGTSDRFYRALYSRMLDADVITSHLKTTFLNLIFNAAEWDKNDIRVVAFLKRILQLGLMGSSSFACAVLILLLRVFAERPKLLSIVSNSEPIEDPMGSDDEETQESESEVDENPDENGNLKLNIVAEEASKKENIKEKVKLEDTDGEYDPFKRDPAHCGVSNGTLLWSLSLYASHVHPTVRELANRILHPTFFRSKVKEFNPFVDKTIMKFLDRLAYKTSNSTEDGDESEDAEAVGTKRSTSTVFGRSKDSKEAPEFLANSPEFIAQSFAKIQKDEQFLYKYFTTKMKMQGGTIEKLKKQKSERNVSVPEISENHEESDDEYAQQLAIGLMKEHAKGGRIDMDEDFDFEENEIDDD